MRSIGSERKIDAKNFKEEGGRYIIRKKRDRERRNREGRDRERDICHYQEIISPVILNFGVAPNFH